jgi:RNA polymerase sigma factor (sigma-70 family)
LKHQGLVRKEAGRVVRRLGAPQLHDDLVSAGNVGLTQYAKRYDPKRGAFSTGATQAIRSKIQREVQRSQTVRVGEKSVARLAKADALPKTGAFKPEHEKTYNPTAAIEHKADVQRLMKQLNPTQREIIRLRHLHGYTAKQVAARTRMSVPQVRKLEKQSLKQMRAAG